MSGKSFGGGMSKAGGGEPSGQKGYVRVPTSGHAVGIASSLGGWPIGRTLGEAVDSDFSEILFSPAEVQSAVRSLFAFLIYDGESYDLEEFFHRRIGELDEASGEFLHFIDIGHPEQSGKRIRQLMIQLALARKWRLLGDEYIRKVLSRGLEHDRRREAMLELATVLEIPQGAPPVIAVATPRGVNQCAWLKIDRAWYSTPEGQAAFGRALLEWAALPLLQAAAERKAFGNELTACVEQSFDFLRRRVGELRQEATEQAMLAALFPGEGWARRREDALLAIECHGMEGERASYGVVSYNGDEVSLTPTQFRIVLCLASKAPNVVGHVDLHKMAGEFPEAKGTSPSRWAKPHMRDIRSAFERSPGGAGLSKEQSHAVFKTEPKGYRLALERSQIFPSQ